MAQMISEPFIDFSFSKRKVTISRNALRVINDPNYFCAAFNREKQILSIGRCERNLPGRHELNEDFKESVNDYEFDADAGFLYQMYLYGGWDKQQDYKVYGHLHEKYPVVLFLLTQGKKINEWLDFDGNLTE